MLLLGPVYQPDKIQTLDVKNISCSLQDQCLFGNTGCWFRDSWMDCTDFFFLLRFCSFSEVMNGNECTASGNVSTSSLFCAAKHDLWQEKEGESSDFTICPPALFSIIQGSLEGFGLTQQLRTSGSEMATIRCKTFRKLKIGTLQKKDMQLSKKCSFKKI